MRSVNWLIPVGTLDGFNWNSVFGYRYLTGNSSDLVELDKMEENVLSGLFDPSTMAG